MNHNHQHRPTNELSRDHYSLGKENIHPNSGESNPKYQKLEKTIVPLNSERLRPIRQKTRNAVVSILEDEKVVLEFLQRRSGEDFVVEVLLISNDGIKVTQYHPNGQRGVLLGDAPPSVTSSNAVSYAFSALPTKLWKKYQYAEKFVRLVKMKTPKVPKFFLICIVGLSKLENMI